MKEQISTLLKIHMDYWPSQVVLTAVELNLFEILGKQSLTAKELGSQLKLSHPRGTFDFFDALVALKFLTRNKEGESAKYKNIPNVPELFSKDKRMMFEGYALWNNLKDALKTGNSIVEKEEVADSKIAHANYDSLYYQNEKNIYEFYYAMDSIQEKNFSLLADKFDFSKYKTLSDIGCASGLLSRTISKKHQNLKIKNFDLPSSAPFVRKIIEEEGFSQSIKVIDGDFLKDELPKSDIITMGNILHNWGIENKVLLIKKAYDALPQNGVFIIIEQLIDDSRNKNLSSLLLSLNMLIEFGEGFSFTKQELQKWCISVGFKKFEFIALDGNGTAAIIYK